jgi:hypothetical protein
MVAVREVGCDSRRRLLVTAALGLSAWLLRPRPSGAAQALVLVTGATSPVSNLSRGDIKRLFLGDPVVLAGQRLTAFNLPPASAERQLFERLALGMTSDQMAKYWIDRRIRGQTGAPKTAPTPEVVLKIAANFPGAVGYVSSGTLSPAVKALTIDGKTSNDPGYLLRG